VFVYLRKTQPSYSIVVGLFTLHLAIRILHSLKDLRHVVELESDLHLDVREVWHLKLRMVGPSGLLAVHYSTANA
jgi:hypothetical protein